VTLGGRGKKLKTAQDWTYNMAKSLGQIHNVNIRAGGFTGSNEKYNLDLAGELTAQLQRMVRAGTYHKLVGIDMNLDPNGTSTQGGQISGRIRYYTPTKGRCDAFRAAFKAMADQMKIQGITMRDNAMYDFRAPLNDDASINLLDNQATLDGFNGLALNHSVTNQSIFGVHNQGQQPQYTGNAPDLYQSGFSTVLSPGVTGIDFVLNDAVPFTGDPNIASEEYEEIPFVVSFEPSTPTSAASSVDFSFRPDPALYIAVLCGQMQIVVDDVILTGGATSLVLNVSAQVSGWKSIMGNPDKKPRRSRRMTSKKKE